MEETINGETPVLVTPKQDMNPTNQPVSFYGDNSRNTDAALLAAIATKAPYEYDYAGMLGAGTGSDLRAEVGELRGVIKDVGSNVRSDIGDLKDIVREEGQDGIAATKDVGTLVRDAQCHILNKLGDVECKIIKENSDQTLYLTNQLSVIREQGIRNEFETKLSREQTIKELGTKIDHKYERLSDQLHHGFEEINEKLCECCGEAAVTAATQNGLLNTIISALNVGGVR